MSETVTIYKIRRPAPSDLDGGEEGASLLPPGGRTEGGRDYVLPAGYAKGRSPDGGPALLDAAGRPCGLMLHNGCPLLIDRERGMAYLLEPVKKLAAYRRLAGLSREELARRLGVPQKELFEWENLEKEPDAAALAKIASILGCDPSDFL